MPAYTAVILIAVIGALCLAMLAAARRWPGDRPWFGAGRGEDERAAKKARYVRVLLARQLLLTLLGERFGELPAAVIARIEQGDPDWCQELLARAAAAGSLEELGLQSEPDASSTSPDSRHS